LIWPKSRVYQCQQMLLALDLRMGFLDFPIGAKGELDLKRVVRGRTLHWPRFNLPNRDDFGSSRVALVLTGATNDPGL